MTSERDPTNLDKNPIIPRERLLSIDDFPENMFVRHTPKHKHNLVSQTRPSSSVPDDGASFSYQSGYTKPLPCHEVCFFHALSKRITTDSCRYRADSITLYDGPSNTLQALNSIYIHIQPYKRVPGTTSYASDFPHQHNPISSLATALIEHEDSDVGGRTIQGTSHYSRYGSPISPTALDSRFNEIPSFENMQL